MTKRILPLLGLAFLSALTVEFLPGDQYLSSAGAGAQVGMLVFFVAFYGTGAILIRETVRRRGLGWRSILLLALAFGVFEEGLLTQSLFDPNYVGQRLLDPAYIPAFGIGALWTVFVLALHVIWSIRAPIALFEANFGDAPRLRRAGLVVCTLIFALGSAGTYAVSRATSDEHFLASPLQLGATAVIAIVLVVLALRVPQRAAVAYRPGGVLVGLVLTTAFQLGSKLDEPWPATAALVALLAIGCAVAGRFRPVALATGAILTYCWVGFLSAADHGPPEMIEQAVIVAAYLVSLVVTLRRANVPTIAHALHTGSDRGNSSGHDHVRFSALGPAAGQAGFANQEFAGRGRDRLRYQGG